MNNINQTHFGSGDNIGGDKIINIQPTERDLNDQIKSDLIKNLKRMGVHNISLIFEYGTETLNFSQKIIAFLISEGFNVYPPAQRMMSGIKPGNYINIEKHPSDSNCAIIVIGSIL